MTNEDKNEKPEENVPKEEPSKGFVIAMGDEQHTLRFPEADFADDVYVTARPTDVDEDEVLHKGFQMKYDMRSNKPGGDGGEDVEVSATLSAAAAFVAKCETQITDFRLPVREKDGTEGFRFYKSSGSVADRDNREVYVRLLGNPDIRRRVEGFLDFIAGRETSAKEEFAELKNEHPQLLSTS